MLPRSREVVALRVRKASKLGVGRIFVKEVRSNFPNSPFAHHIPLSPAHHQTERCTLRRPQAAPFAHDFIVPADDPIDSPDRIEDAFELSPVLCEMLSSAYRWETGGQEIVNHFRVKGTQQRIEIARVAPIE